MTDPQARGEAILKLLQQANGFVSGEDLRRRLGITRAAVWKQVEYLRSQGFHIEGVSSMGYRLGHAPDVLRVLEYDPGISTLRIGRKIVVREETGSTNDDARRLGREGAQEGTVVLAEAQTAGRGRRGRQWASPARLNLYFSTVLRPPIAPADAPMITLMAAVRLCRVFRELFDLDARIKWPNDLLLGGKKTAGILAEMEAEQERIEFLVLGIGVNLNMTEEMFPRDMLYPATSVAIQLGTRVERVAFVRRLMESLDQGYDALLSGGAGQVRKEWMRYCAHASGIVEVRTSMETLAGRFVGIGEDGAMILETAGKGKQKIHAGDVVRMAYEQVDQKNRRG